MVVKALKVDAPGVDLLNPGAKSWQQAAATTLGLSPAPLDLVKARSPFLALSRDHGRVREIAVAALHNGSDLAIRLSWAAPTKNDHCGDLDAFVDAVAVLFPLAPGATAVTMGSDAAPANAWYWKADAAQPYDVLAKGYGRTERRAASSSRLQSAATHDGAVWTVIFQRPLSIAGNDFVTFAPGTSSGIAVAAWDGGNAERSGRKSFSGEFVALEIEA